MNSMQKVWICGASGRVGTKMTEQLNGSNVELLLTDVDDVDITDPKAVMDFANINRPHYIVNCAGVTDVNVCEQNMELAFKINALGARNLSVAARMGKARMIHISTDDIFDGESTKPYTEFDTPNPQTIYGKSKLAGENFVKEFCNRHIIVRSSWIFGDGSGYVSQILKEIAEGKTIYAAEDQTGVPTGASDLASKIIYLMKSASDGIYHVTGQGHCTRYEFAKEIVRLSGHETKVIPVPANQDKLTAMRPTYSVLDNLMLRMSQIELLPDWRVMLEQYMTERKN
ncbi:dTDP-4-dehydrorhamnose reductase [Clostridium sp. E02]|uniref:dTDP-4-dehydrorhamnose reductase n=1 Tax=Clostridium sp. E02 TaxID=2487134 RepID=UPI00325B72B8